MNIEIVHLKSHTQGIESWIALFEGEVVGHIYMQVELDRRIKFLDAWVHPNCRRSGIFRGLWEKRWDYVNQEYSGYTIYAWCKENSLPLLLEKGFTTGEICTYVEKKI